LASKKMKERKKKNKERETKQQLLRRKKAVQNQNKAERRKTYLRNKYDKGDTIVTNKSEVVDKLKHNQQILKALQEEYIKEQQAKKELNDKLEAAGHVTLDEKLKAMDEQIREKLQESNIPGAEEFENLEE